MYLTKRINLWPLVLTLLLLGEIPCQAQGASHEAVNAAVEYKTVADALAGLRAKPSVTVRDEGGWTIAEERDAFTMWTFVPAGHPAYPAVIKRRLQERDGTLFVNMSVLCEANKTECDKLLEQFQQLNKGLAERMQQR
jgi:hypothetical protein